MTSWHLDVSARSLAPVNHVRAKSVGPHAQASATKVPNVKINQNRLPSQCGELLREAGSQENNRLANTDMYLQVLS